MHIPPLDGPNDFSAQQTQARLDQLTKPQGSLGAIEKLAIRLASIAPLPRHGYTHRVVFIGAADHGVTNEGISAYPAEVTVQMVQAFVGGYAAINAFARSAQATVYVADFGMLTLAPPTAHLFQLAIGPGTANLANRPAMTADQYERAFEAGMLAVTQILERGPLEILALGEMGIGNTTSATALIAALTGAASHELVGRGTGIDDARLLRKRSIIASALARCAHDSVEAKIAALGGFEIVGLAGALVACAARRIPVLLDGLIVAAAALVAQAVAPTAITAAIATHLSTEPAHRYALEYLGLEPFLQLELRLGEATGATLAFGLCDAAARMVGEMRTFAEANVATAHSAVEGLDRS